MAQTNGKTTTRTTDAKTTTADARTAPTQPDEPTQPDVPQPVPSETSNTYADRVDLENALTNSTTSPRADVPTEDV